MINRIFRRLQNNTFCILLGEDICYAHCKDVLLTQNIFPSFEWVVAGTGTMDYETYLVRLSRLKYPRTLLIEGLAENEYPQAKNS